MRGQFRVEQHFTACHTRTVRKKRVILLCLIGAALAFIALFTYKPTSREPSYGGHALSFWVTSLGDIDDDIDHYRKTTNAIGHIGVAALPFLLEWIQCEPTPWRTTVGAFLKEIPFSLAHKLSRRVTEPRAYYLAEGTPHAFAVLGKRALPAFNDLCRLMNETNSPYTADGAARALAGLGTNALVALLAVATNAHHPTRLGALGAIGNMSDMGEAAQIAVPAIANCLTETNQTVQMIAITVLGNLREAPQISIPALVSALKSKNAKLRLYSAKALGDFGSQASNAIPALTNALTDSDTLVRYNAADALHQIDPATFTNFPGQ